MRKNIKVYDEVFKEMKKDYLKTIGKSIYMNEVKIKNGITKRFLRSIIRIFAPLL